LLAGPFLAQFSVIAERHPSLKLIIDHCGLMRLKQDDAAFADLDTLLALARLPNVAIKATGAPGYSTQPCPFRNLHDGLHRIFDAYGPHRFFWGTDITRMPCSYRQCVSMFTEELPWLRNRDLELVMGEALCDWLGWSPKPHIKRLPVICVGSNSTPIHTSTTNVVSWNSGSRSQA
jgi:predicted TIM-barrel fold metal-dependent hydrolase